MEETAKLTAGLEEERKSAEAAAKKYMDLCYEFLKEQDKALEDELGAGQDAA